MNIPTKSEVRSMSKAESVAYIAALTTEVDRLQRRSRAHRQNLRSMQAKLVGVNLRQELLCLMQPQPLKAAWWPSSD